MASSNGKKRAAMTSKTLVWTVEALQWKSARGDRREGDWREGEEKNKSGAALSVEFQGTERIRMWSLHFPWSRSALATPRPNSRGSGSAPLHSHHSTTKHM
jgi:hypothetical protein